MRLRRTLAVLLAGLAAVSVVAAGPGSSAPVASVRDGSLSAGEAEAATATVPNGVQFLDTAGNVVHGHDGGIIKVSRYYYWFGENPYWSGENHYLDNRFRYIPVYRSTDLRTWQFRRNVLTEASAPGVENLQRPKVVYNARTKQYVLFMHKENHPHTFPCSAVTTPCFTEWQIGIATSPTVDGNYTYRRSFRPLGKRSGDVNVFRDSDGTAYLISSTPKNFDLVIYRMTPDYLYVAARVATLAGVKREGQAMFKRNGVYFLVSSGVTGWLPNQAKYATATHIKGPWSRARNYGDSIAYGSQSSYVLPIQGSATTSYLYMGDRHGGAWGGGITDGEYVWLPLQFPSNRSLSMRWYPRVSINTATGVVRGVGSGQHAYQELRARHSGKCLHVRRASKAEGAGVTQQTCGTAANPNQHWQVLNLGNGYYRLTARHSHQCLTVQGSSTANKAGVTQQTCGTVPDLNQQWRFTTLGRGYYRIHARHSGKCLTIGYKSAIAGPEAIQYTCKDTGNQQWKQVGAPY